MDTEKTFPSPAIIDDNNFENYLSQEEEILPELKNGDTRTLIGEIVALQSTKGEILKFKAFDLPQKYQTLVLYPRGKNKTEHYKDFYKEKVQITAEIYRKSPYKRPELLLKAIHLIQGDLLKEIEEKSGPNMEP